jgi:hypothetical protein
LSQMRAIYREASSVMSWLGPECGGIGLLMSVAKKHDPTCTTAKSLSIVSLPKHLSTLQADLTGLVFGLYKRIVVATRITTICGKDMMGWGIFAKFLVTAHNRCSKGSHEQYQFIPPVVILGLWYWPINNC